MGLVGLGLAGRPPEPLADLSWIYFPGPEAGFFRATFPAGFSPANVPESGPHWSILCETSAPPGAVLDPDRLPDEALAGLRATGLLGVEVPVVSRWTRVLGHGYPVPSLERDAILADLLPALEARGIFSRGRFGAWRYEVSNQDHSLMQGVELVDRLLGLAPELTLVDPAAANAPGRRPAPRPGSPATGRASA